MTSFIPEVWMDRAQARFKRAKAAGKPDADERYALETSCIDGLQKVISWCSSRNITVEFCRCSGGILEDDHRLIRCSSKARPDVQLYTILHECGHFLIGRAHPKNRFLPVFRASASNCRWLNSCAIWCVRKSSGREERNVIR